MTRTSWSSLIRALGASLLLVVMTAAGAAEPVRRIANPTDATDRVIIKFRLPPTAQGVPSSGTGAADDTAALATARIAALTARAGTRLEFARSIGTRLHVAQLPRTMRGEELAGVLAKLSADPGVEYAVADGRKYRAAVPNDPLYGQTPITHQWWLTTPNSTIVSSIDAAPAWDLTIGDPGIVVAVLDTGVRFEHEDLGRVAQGGKLLPGFDFVGGANPTADTIRVANDGDGWDPDPSDPGDWIDASDRARVLFQDCELADSSWHGTHIAGIIGARSNNGIGVAGVGWNTRVLPVRVLGKCFGYDSDIIAAMRWAGGIAVPGAPPNPTPARVITMSLGSPGACNSAYQSAVDELRNRNVLVVAAAGNQGTRGSVAPANCNGVVSVTALRHLGTKVGFANFGPDVTIAAPGGNCINLTGSCLYPIVSTDNAGRTIPGANIYGGKLGTSFSTPIVAGVAALMLSRDPLLTNAQLIDRLRFTTRLFPPPDPTLLSCSDPAFAADGSGVFPNDGQCNCNESSCGSGMLDAGMAVRSVTNVVAVVTGPASAAVGTTVAFDATSSLPVPRQAIAGYQWTVLSGPGAAVISGETTSRLTFRGDALGTYVLRLAVTDTANTTDHSDFSVAVVAQQAPPSGGGGGGGGGGATNWWLLSLLAVMLSAALTMRSYRRRARHRRSVERS